MGWVAKLAAMMGLSNGTQLVVAEPQDSSSSASSAETLPELPRDFPYPVETVDGREAIKEWKKLKAKGEGWPVMVGGDEDLARLAEQVSYNSAAGDKPQEAIKAASDIDVSAVLKALYDAEYGEDPFDVPLGEWPAGGASGLREPTVPYSLMTGKPLDRVHIVIVPASAPADVPAYLYWGGWNACPEAMIHVAIMRKWAREYGAEVVSMSGDVINLRVGRRPQSRQEAMKLAYEQYYYCSDIVLQGTGELSTLAASLMESDYWYFWWD